MATDEQLRERIRQVRDESRLSQAGLALQIGIPVHKIKDIETRVSPSREFLDALVEILHVRPEFLGTGQLPIFKELAEQNFQSRLKALSASSGVSASLALDDAYQQLAQEAIYALSQSPADAKGFKAAADAFLERQNHNLKAAHNDEHAYVPFYDVRVAAGAGRALLDEQTVPLAYNAYRKAWLRQRGLDPKQLFEVIVVGDSMHNELRDGDTVLVDASQQEIRGGGNIYVLRMGDDYLVKYLQKLPGGRVQVSSENSHAYPSYTIEASEFATQEVAVVGLVVRQGRERTSR